MHHKKEYTDLKEKKREEIVFFSIPFDSSRW